jgi:OOP family OmpA-OmpF porin
VLYDQVAGAFDDVEGANVSAGDFELAQSSDLEAALNGLDPIEFDSGSPRIRAESESILDEAAALLNANPDVALEIGGHTDSIGGADANQALSEARAQAVFDALQDRDVTNDLRPRGFGETRLKVANDEDDPAAQQENRRIEFRIIG